MGDPKPQSTDKSKIKCNFFIIKMEELWIASQSLYELIEQHDHPCETGTNKQATAWNSKQQAVCWQSGKPMSREGV